MLPSGGALHTMASDAVGSYRYMAPEIYRREPHGVLLAALWPPAEAGGRCVNKATSPENPSFFFERQLCRGGGRGRQAECSPLVHRV